ncbi:hypothetical protein [Verrucomicrobium spinosum]|uniref:hypothetical protein n=1 Tax=Verrucomicrobium spinosum TaxID=2736 RepID=UPI0009466C0C|nr:hypothetical protein [Verrucomicrobium spinosum]
MSPLSLELGLGLLGLVLLLVESFANMPRKLIAYAAIGGLLAALAVVVSGAAGSVPDSLQEFYVVDPLALFYKALPSSPRWRPSSSPWSTPRSSTNSWPLTQSGPRKRDWVSSTVCRSLSAWV